MVMQYLGYWGGGINERKKGRKKKKRRLPSLVVLAGHAPTRRGRVASVPQRTSTERSVSLLCADDVAGQVMKIFVFIVRSRSHVSPASPGCWGARWVVYIGRRSE